MMDPVVLFVIGGAIISLLVVLTYYFFSKEESDFEKVYNTKALALLTEPDKKEKKGKNKNKKEKRQQQLQQREQQKEQQPKEEVESSEEDEPKNASKVEKVVESVAVKEVVQVTAAPAPQPTKEVISPVKTGEAPKEHSPKPSPKHESPQENGKKKPAKSVNVKELDHKKVISRLSVIADLEEGYVQFLTTTFREGELLKNNLSSEVKALSKKLVDANQKFDKLQKEKNVLADREKQELSKQSVLTSKVQSLQSREVELSESVQVAQAEIQQREEAHKKEIQQLRSKVTHLENEVHSQKTNNGKLSTQLTTVQGQLAKALNTSERAGCEAEIARLNEEIAKFEKVVREVNAHLETKMADYSEISQDAARMEQSISELEESLASSRRELVAQTEREARKDQVLKELESEKENWHNETSNCEALKKAIGELNDDVLEFHKYKKQQDTIVEELKTSKQKRIDELEAEKAKLQKAENDLRKDLEIERSRLVAAEQALADEKARIVTIPQNSATSEAVEEVFELKKTNTDLAAAPSTSTPSSDLDAKVAQLEEKNEELRSRNYAILEKTEEIPKALINERKRVVEQVGKLVKTPFKNVDDETAFFEWLGKSVIGVEKDLAAPKKATTVAPKPVPVLQTAAPVPPVQTAPSRNDGFYRSIVIDLLSQLEKIGELADRVENPRAQKV